MNETTKNTILLVDDDRFHLKTLNKILSPEYTIYTAESGQAALQLTFEYMPDVILLDVIIPDMNGFEVLNILKSTKKTEKIPVIIITGLDSVEYEEKGLALNAADFITKPFNASIVKSRILHQVQIVNQIRALEQYSQLHASIAVAEEKNKFFARMSHEMRTPLNAIVCLSELTLEANGLSSEARKNVEHINNAGTSLYSLVNDILDMSKIQEGKFELVQVEYELADLINDAVVQSIMRKGEKPIEFVLNIDETIPKNLVGDGFRIRQILTNLMTNAFKYTQKGTVELNISYKELGFINGKENLLLTASVKDTGVGIRKEDLDKLFKEFFQIDVKSYEKIEGTGLGLPISKMLTEQMNGIIEVKSEYGKGSIFTVKIPQIFIPGKVVGKNLIAKLKEFRYQTKWHKTRLPRINLSYAHVLVVDDIAINHDVAKGILKPYRVKVDCVTSGQAAVDAIREEKVKYNAIFMDQMMPEMDGIEALRIIREEIGTEYAKNIPVIAFTANAIPGNAEMLLSKGFQAFMPKPVDLKLLDNILRLFVRDEELEKNLTEQQLLTNDEATFDEHEIDQNILDSERRSGYDRRDFSVITGFDCSQCLKHFNGDIEIVLTVLRSFASNSALIINNIKEVNSENLSNYAINVHGLKSSCKSICVKEAGVMAEALETAAKAGSLDFVTENNPAFIELIGKLITDINYFFETEDNNNKSEKPKHKKEKPYKEVLLKLKNACENYDATTADNLMEEIEVFEYTADDGLVQWLRENIGQLNYMEIAERLSEENLS